MSVRNRRHRLFERLESKQLMAADLGAELTLHAVAADLGEQLEWADTAVQDIVVTKESDKSTPKLCESILTGAAVDEAVADGYLSVTDSDEASDVIMLSHIIKSQHETLKAIMSR